MQNTDCKVVSVINDKIFRNFALFDTFIKQKHWRSPAIFAAIMLISASACFFMRNAREGAMTLCTVLAFIGIALPVVYVLSFFISVKSQIKRLGLKEGKEAYTSVLTQHEISISSGEESAEFKWETLHFAYRAKNCIYLYISPKRAYLLPNSGAEPNIEAAWSLIKEKLGGEKSAVL